MIKLGGRASVCVRLAWPSHMHLMSLIWPISICDDIARLIWTCLLGLDLEIV